MNTLNFKNQQMKELSINEMQKVEGGFVPFIIWGVYVSANTVAAAAGIATGAGIYLATH